MLPLGRIPSVTYITPTLSIPIFTQPQNKSQNNLGHTFARHAILHTTPTLTMDTPI